MIFAKVKHELTYSSVMQNSVGDDTVLKSLKDNAVGRAQHTLIAVVTTRRKTVARACDSP